MRLINILLGFVVLLCCVVVSFAHTVTMYERVGFDYWEGIAITIAVETVFLLGSLNMIVSHTKRESASLYSWTGFMYGLFQVTASNVSYLAGLDFLYDTKIAHWTLALSIPVGVLVAKLIVSSSILEPKKQPNNKPDNHPTKQVAKQSAEPSSIKQPENHTEVNQQVNKPNQPSNKPNDRANRHTINQPTQKADEKEINKQAGNQANFTEQKQPTKGPNIINRKSSKKYATDLTPIKQEAIKYKESKGKLPSRDKLAELTGYSVNACRRALVVLRESNERSTNSTYQPTNKTVNQSNELRPTSPPINESGKQPNKQPNNKVDRQQNQTNTKTTRQDEHQPNESHQATASA